MTPHNNKNIVSLIKGASIFTCGGGFPMEDQLAAAQKMLKEAGENFSVEIRDASELESEDYMISVTQVGPSDAPEISKREMLRPMLDSLEKVTGKKISSI